MKKALSMLLVLMLLLGMMPMQAFATEGTQETEAAGVVTEPTEAPEEETTAPTEETESSEEEEKTEPSGEEEEEVPSEPSESEEEPEVIHEHDYKAVVTDPTCTEEGYTTYTCACGDSYVSDYVDATDHTYKNGICTVCGEEDYDGLDLNGLNVLCLGDSITAGQGLTTETRWTNVLASKYGWNLTNKSQGGISLSSYYYTANGKSNVSIAKKAEILKTMTTKPDVIIVWGGHNDTSYRYSPLGTWDDETTDSFKGALKYIAELADEYAPDATLFVLTPLWTTEAPSTLKVPENTTDNNWMFVDAIYEGAEAYGWIPVNMDLCGITPFTKSGLLLDNIHPNEAGTEKIVAYLSAELASYSETSKKETIIFNASAVSMKPGESTTLKAVLSPRSGTGTMTFTWSSSDSSVATVDTSGKITAVAPGTAVITATAPNGISADISVSVVCEHTYEPSVTAPTCTEQGYTTYTCECGDSYVADLLDSTGHSYENGICTDCGAKHPNLANYEGKVISILGGSNCTFAGYIPVADGFNLEHRSRYPDTSRIPDVTDVSQTWWMQLLTQMDAKLGINDSWAGSQVLNTLDSNSGDLGPDAAMASLTRIQNLGTNGTPDVILFFGGCNDIGRGVNLGSFNPATAPTQADLTATKWDSFADAYVAAITRIQHFYPDAQILVMLPYNSSTYFIASKVDKYGAVIRAICDHYGVAYVDLRDCGINSSHLPDNIHPNAEGSDYITTAVLNALLSSVELEDGENVVHSVTHKLTGAKSSLGHYRGVSDRKSFVTTITGENVTVTVTMGGVVITNQVYADGKISISAVTGDVVITAQGKYNAEGRLQQLPDDHCCNTNLWTVLDPVNEYYTASGWGNNSNSNYSVTFPVTPGDQLWATSFGAAGTNGYTANAVRITWFGEDGVLKSLGRDTVYAEFAKHGYITVPEGATAVNIPMVSNADTWEIYILNRDHCYENGVCTACGHTNRPVITQQPVDGEAKLGERYMVEVKAEGEGLKYQWYFRNAGSKTWYKSSVKDNTYDDVMTAARAGRVAYCVITDALGNTVKTDTVKLVCLPSEKLEIIQQPTNGEAALGERYCVTVEAKGESLKYQWYFRNKGAKSWTKSSVTDNTYDDVMTATRDGREVYCIITDLAGNKVTTDTVKLVRVPMKLEIVSQPTDASAPFNQRFCVTVKAKGEGLKYQWYYRNAGGLFWYKSGVRDNTYDDTMTKARNGREVYCVITDKYGNSVTTDIVKLIAVPEVELKLLSLSYEGAAMGERYCVSVEAQGDGLKYQWYFRNAGATRWSMSSVRDNTYDDVMNKTRANREVYCVITDAFGNQVTTETVTLVLSK